MTAQEVPSAATLAIRPLQWSILPELPDTVPLDPSDLACLDELRGVLARHGKLNRFAVHLAHRHLDLAPDEILVERPDPDGRTQHVTVGRRDDHPEAVPTTWLLDDAPALSLSNAVYCVCVSTPLALGACVRHGKSSGPGEGAQQEEAIRQRRIAEEKARHERGFPVGGNDGGRER